MQHVVILQQFDRLSRFVPSVMWLGVLNDLLLAVRFNEFILLKYNMLRFKLKQNKNIFVYPVFSGIT